MGSGNKLGLIMRGYCHNTVTQFGSTVENTVSSYTPSVVESTSEASMTS